MDATSMELSYSSIAPGVVRNGHLSSRAPSPPYVHVPAISPQDVKHRIAPSFNAARTGLLSAADILTITGGRPQTSANSRGNDTWRYEHRRTAQSILDFLYLGPMSMVRDHAFLKEHGITMLLDVRDASMAALGSVSIVKAAAELNLETQSVNLANTQDLILNFPGCIQKINDHVLRFNTAASRNPKDSRYMPGKVMVVCQTGNDRSASIVAAYIMAMYGCDVIHAVQFVNGQRFCTNFDEPTKNLLLSYEELLEATMMTRAAGERDAVALSQRGGAYPSNTKKRGIDETLEGEEDGDLDMDRARFGNRSDYAPFSEENSEA